MSREIEIQCLGYSVKADVYDGSEKDVVLMLVGYTSEKAKYVKFAEKIAEELGSTVVVLDYSGHGESPFNIMDISPAENFIEVVRTFDRIKELYAEASVIVIGTSYGGFLGAQLTKYRQFDKLVMRVPGLLQPETFYTKWGDMDIEKLREYRETADNLIDHPLLKRAGEFEGKAFVVLHEKDEICNINSTQPFIDAFKADSWVAPGLQHGFHSSGISEVDEQAYYRKIIDWLKK